MGYMLGNISEKTTQRLYIVTSTWPFSPHCQSKLSFVVSSNALGEWAHGKKGGYRHALLEAISSVGRISRHVPIARLRPAPIKFWPIQHNFLIHRTVSQNKCFCAKYRGLPSPVHRDSRLWFQKIALCTWSYDPCGRFRQSGVVWTQPPADFAPRWNG